MNTLVRIVITLFVSVLFSAALYSQDRIQTGREALERGDMAKALQVLKEATQKDKKNQQAFYWYAMALYRADSLDQAVVQLTLGRELDPKNPAIYELMGDVYAKQKLMPAAAQQYKQAYDIDSTSVPLLIKLADANRRTRQYNEAARYYLKVLATDSMNVHALRQSGSLFARARQWANALPLYRRLYPLQQDTTEVQYYYLKSMHETAQSNDTAKFKEIIAVAQRILERDPDNEEVRAMQANAQIKTGDVEQAIKFYDRAKLDSLSTDQLLQGFKLYRTVDSSAKALKVIETAYRKDSTNCKIFYDLGTAYMKVKQYEEAASAFDKKIACDTSAGYQFASHLNKAMSLMQIKRFQDAETEILAAIEHRPQDVRAWQTLAQNYMQYDQSAKARGAYQKVIDLVTTEAENGNGDVSRYAKQLFEAYQTIGYQLVFEKKWVEALKYLKQAERFNPKDCSLLLVIAQAYHNNQNREEAKKYYCRVINGCSKAKEAQTAQEGLGILGEKCE